MAKRKVKADKYPLPELPTDEEINEVLSRIRATGRQEEKDPDT